MFVPQSEYVEKILKRFHMDITHLLSNQLVIRTFDLKKDTFQPIENGERYLVMKYHILMQLVLCYTWINILDQILHYL